MNRNRRTLLKVFGREKIWKAFLKKKEDEGTKMEDFLNIRLQMDTMLGLYLLSY